MRYFIRGFWILLVAAAVSLNAAYAAQDPKSSGDSGSMIGAAADPDGQAASNNTSGIFGMESLTKLASALNPQAEILPVQIASVHGDEHKFEALNWLNRGYSGGVKDLSTHYQAAEDITVDMSGRAIAGNNDYRGNVAVTKKDFAYLNFDFKQFRKYYDTYGGVFNGYSKSLSRDLFLDIGHIGIEAGIAVPDYPKLAVFYEHDYRNGSKSMLDWASVTGNIPTKKISPSWKEIDETVDTVGLKGDHTVGGYHITGDQRWEIAQGKTRGYQQPYDTTTGPGTLWRQDIVPETTLMTTHAGVDKWYWGDKVFGSTAYRFEHLKNEERENISNFTNGKVLATSNTSNRFDATAHNNQNVSSWVANLMVNPWSWLTGKNSFKAEINNRTGDSYFPTNSGGNWGITSRDISDTESDTYKFAETTGLRVKLIPRTALYGDLSFEQSRNHLLVARVRDNNSASGENSTRDAIIDEPVATWVLGTDIQPIRMLNLTSQFRWRRKNMDFDDSPRVKGVNGQVYLETLETTAQSFTQRATLRLCGWATASARYVFEDTDYTARAVYDNVDEKSRMLSNTFVYDITGTPREDLTLTGSLTQRQDWTKTPPASDASSQEIPAIHSNFYTWMFGTDYQPHEKIGFDGTLFYTAADNINDFKNYNQPTVYYGADYSEVGLTVGCKWQPKKNLTIHPQYGYSRFSPNDNSGIGGAFDAQIISVSLKTTWD